MKTTNELTQFRARLYSSFPGRGDALMDLLDALASNQNEQSVVRLSLSPVFRSSWSNVYKVIDRFFKESSAWMASGERMRLEQRMLRETNVLLEPPRRRNHWLFGLDTTPISRLYASTLSDRSYVHQSDTPGPGVPVTIGHQYSLVVGFPEEEDPFDPSWVFPLSSRRVPSARTANEVGQLQIQALLDDPKLPWYEQLVVVMGDSAYGCRPFLGPLGQYENLVLLTRARPNRVFYRPPDPGSRRWYGARFCLKDRRTWTDAVEVCGFCQLTAGGKRIEYRVERFADLRVRGSRSHAMHRRPFDLLRVTRFDEKGKPLGGPMWLIVMGERRAEIETTDAVLNYLQRFDQEHFHRFARQNLLLDKYQTPETEHEESWIAFCMLAYAQLYAARKLAKLQRNPWERARTGSQGAPLSPTEVQRDFARLLSDLGTPARHPKPRNIGVGRIKGQPRRKRKRQSPQWKGKSRSKRARAPAQTAG